MVKHDTVVIVGFLGPPAEPEEVCRTTEQNRAVAPHTSGFGAIGARACVSSHLLLLDDDTYESCKFHEDRRKVLWLTNSACVHHVALEITHQLYVTL